MAYSHPVKTSTAPAADTTPSTAHIAARPQDDGDTRGMSAAIARGALVVLLYSGLAIFFTWPLALHLHESVTSSIDPVDSIWRVGWGQYRLLHNPLQLFTGNTFYPYADTYLFDELVLGSAVLTLPLAVFAVPPLVIYNIAVLLTLVLCGGTMYALARRFSASPVAAFLAGGIYAFAPMHLDRIGHLGILSTQWYPLILLLIDRIILRPRAWAIIALTACLVMQVLSSQYHAIYLVVVVPLFLLVMLVRRPETRRASVLVSLVAAGLLAFAVVSPLAVGYRRVQTEYVVERTYGQVAYYSASLSSFITADGRNRLWGTVTAPLREQGRYTFERNMFPGAFALLLAGTGLWSGRRRPWEQFCGMLVVIAAIFALGPELRTTPDTKSLLFGHLPYDILYWHLPGWDSMRAPGRFGALFLLGIAGLAASGATVLRGKLAALHLPRLGKQRWLSVVGAVLMLFGTGAEYANHPFALVPLPGGDAIPPVYRWLAAQPDATIIELPLVVPDHEREQQIAVREQYFSLVHHYPMVNGNANVLPKGYKALVAEMVRMPSPRTVSLLQGLGITHVVMHWDQLPPDIAPRLRERLRSVTGLVIGEEWEDTTVYRVAPTDRFADLRARIPVDATVTLSREDPLKTGAYMGMVGYVLRDNPLYANLRVDFGQNYRGAPQPGTRYEYAALFVQEDPASVGFDGAEIIWQDDTIRVYKR